MDPSLKKVNWVFPPAGRTSRSLRLAFVPPPKHPSLFFTPPFLSYLWGQGGKLQKTTPGGGAQEEKGGNHGSPKSPSHVSICHKKVSVCCRCISQLVFWRFCHSSAIRCLTLFTTHRFAPVTAHSLISHLHSNHSQVTSATGIHRAR